MEMEQLWRIAQKTFWIALAWLCGRSHVRGIIKNWWRVHGDGTLVSKGNNREQEAWRRPSEVEDEEAHNLFVFNFLLHEKGFGLRIDAEIMAFLPLQARTLIHYWFS